MSWAVCDWGIGGLGFYKLLKEKIPSERILYWSDSGSTPYGKMSRQALRARVDQVLQELHTRGASRVVIACNAASTVIPHLTVPRRVGLQVTGVIEPTIAAILEDGAKRRLGIIGGRRTVVSQVYARELRRAGHLVHQRIAQPLSALVEAGDIDSIGTKQAVHKILQPMLGVETLIMACTHYVALQKHFSNAMPETHFVDPAEETLKWIEAHWGLSTSASPHATTEAIWTTGNPEHMQSAAMAAFGIQLTATRIQVMDPS